MSIKLNDTQLMLLSGASQRDDRHMSSGTHRRWISRWTTARHGQSLSTLIRDRQA